MNDLISRQEALDTLNDEFTIIGKTNAIIVQDYIRRVKNRLHDLPSAQPERKKGRWLPFDPPLFRCSECGATRENKTFMENFCPNCGADLRQEERDG